MMLDWLGRRRVQPELIAAAHGIEAAVTRVLAEGKTLPADQGGSASTTQVGDAVAKVIE